MHITSKMSSPQTLVAVPRMKCVGCVDCISSTGGHIPYAMRMPLSNPVMSLVCVWLSRRERYQIIVFSLKVSVFGTCDFVGFASVG